MAVKKRCGRYYADMMLGTVCFDFGIHSFPPFAKKTVSPAVTVKERGSFPE